jgi:hypothetical protein
MTYRFYFKTMKKKKKKEEEEEETLNASLQN